jgi:tight adherence protein C
MFEYLPYMIILLAFGAVAVTVIAIGQQLSAQAQLQRRLTAPVQDAGAPGRRTMPLQGFITKHFDERRFGVDNTLRGKLRRELIRAGFFRSDALNYYIFSRMVTVLVLPSLAYAGAEYLLADQSWLFKLLLLVLAFLLAVAGPDVYLSRRQRTLSERYRALFPDFLDLLTVCVDAGLSLEAALDRITSEMSRQNRELGLNLLMMSAEMRAGRSTIEALDSLSDRLILDEARSLVLMLRQSIELGSDVNEALRVFSDELREKRLLRAEEKANKLPVKMVLPLGLFIFPVILGVVMLPIMIRLITVVFR